MYVLKNFKNLCKIQNFYPMTKTNADRIINIFRWYPNRSHLFSMQFIVCGRLSQPADLIVANDFDSCLYFCWWRDMLECHRTEPFVYFGLDHNSSAYCNAIPMKLLYFERKVSYNTHFFAIVAFSNKASFFFRILFDANNVFSMNDIKRFVIDE